MSSSVPVGWAARLAERLKTKDVQFSAFMAIKNGEFRADDFGNAEVASTDPQANATLVTASALSAVLGALNELPEFAGNEGLASLHSLLAALGTLDNGGSPDLLKPRADVIGKKRHFGRDYVEDHALLCVELLIALDNRSRTLARKAVAEVFSAQGHRGRKRASGLLPALSEKSIYEWEARFEALPPNSQRRTWLSENVKKYTRLPEWPPSEPMLMEEIARIARHPLLKTKI